jgi:methylated-DNA-protein-cysteine methyltransferase-like protein
MPGSPAFARVKSEVMAVAHAVPPGRVTTFAAVGVFLDLSARQVAYLLALRNDEAREAAPWHRVVGEGGALGKPKRNGFGESQAELLAAEGVDVGPDGRVLRFDALFFPVTRETTGVTPGPRGSGPSSPG